METRHGRALAHEGPAINTHMSCVFGSGHYGVSFLPSLLINAPPPIDRAIRSQLVSRAVDPSSSCPGNADLPRPTNRCAHPALSTHRPRDLIEFVRCMPLRRPGVLAACASTIGPSLRSLAPHARPEPPALPDAPAQPVCGPRRPHRAPRSPHSPHSPRSPRSRSAPPPERPRLASAWREGPSLRPGAPKRERIGRSRPSGRAGARSWGPLCAVFVPYASFFRRAGADL